MAINNLLTRYKNGFDSVLNILLKYLHKKKTRGFAIVMS